MRLQPPDDGLLARATPFLRLLAEAARELGGRLEVEADFLYLARYRPPTGRARPIFGKSLGLNSDAAAALAADKHYTACLLKAAGLPAPDGILAFAPGYRAAMALKNRDVADRLNGRDAAESFADAAGFPVIAKPNTGREGRGIHRAGDRGELRDALALLFETEPSVRIEQWLPGRDYRLIVFDGAVVLGYERRPLSVTGDGRRPVSELLQEALATLSRRHRGAKLSIDDPRISRSLAAAGLTQRSVLAAGRTFPLLDNANLSTGGSLIDLTGRLPRAAEQLAVSAAEAIGLTLAGVDILARDLASDVAGAVILEVNSAPGLDYYASSGPLQWARARALIRRMLARLDEAWR